MECGIGAMDVEKIGVGSAAAPMVDDDNEPAPENHPLHGEMVDDIFSGWTHSGICKRRALISRNTKMELTFSMNKSVEPTNLQIFKVLFFTSFIKSMILPQTNNNLPTGEKHVQYEEFLCWLGLWMLMGTLIGLQRHEFWATHPINAFHGAPLHLGVWMSRKCFNTILSALSITDAIPPTLIENAQRHFQHSLFGCFEYVPYTALTIVCTITVSIDCKKNRVSNPFTRKNILDYKSRQ